MYAIRVTDGQQRFLCGPEQDLLQTARRQAVPIPQGCRGGGCGMCKIRVVSGSFERGLCSKAVLSDSEREANYTLACKTFPNSDLEIELL